MPQAASYLCIAVALADKPLVASFSTNTGFVHQGSFGPLLSLSDIVAQRGPLPKRA
jgi:hypothetical protein